MRPVKSSVLSLAKVMGPAATWPLQQPKQFSAPRVVLRTSRFSISTGAPKKLRGKFEQC